MQVTISQFARLLGEQVRKTREASVPFHKAFVGATAEQQGEMRDSWILNHLTGQFATPNVKPENKDADTAKAAAKAKKVCEQSRTTRTREAQAAYDKARADFSYHVVRATKSNKTEPAKAPRISREERAAWAAFVSTVGADRAALIAKTLG